MKGITRAIVHAFLFIKIYWKKYYFVFSLFSEYPDLSSPSKLTHAPYDKLPHRQEHGFFTNKKPLVRFLGKGVKASGKLQLFFTPFRYEGQSDRWASLDAVYTSYGGEGEGGGTGEETPGVSSDNFYLTQYLSNFLFALPSS